MSTDINSQKLIDSFEERQATKKSESTAHRYARDVEEWVEFLENPGSLEWDDGQFSTGVQREPKSIFEATKGDLSSYLQGLLGAEYSSSTVNIRLTSVSVFYQSLDELAEQGLPMPEVPENPAENLDTSGWSALDDGTMYQQEGKEEVHYLSPEQVSDMIDACDMLMHKLIIQLLYQTGLRRGELADIRLEDIDRDARAIDVRATKTHENRTVYYQPSLDDRISMWIDIDRKCLATADSPYLFCTRQSEQIAGKHINWIVQEAADSAEIQEPLGVTVDGRHRKRISAHSLRHTFAVQSLKNGMDTRTLQKLLGHATIETTEKYLKLAESDIAERARRYGAGSES
jgi:integrase/recombinase XerD